MATGIRWRWREEKVIEPPAVYADRIGELAAILDGLPWILGGGLAIPFTRGDFHREHADIDVLFDDRAFPDIEAAFARHGYELWQHYTMSFFGALAGAWHIRLHEHSFLARIRRRKLKFRDGTGIRRTPHLLAAIDALPFRIRDGVLHSCDGRHHIPMTHPLVGHRARSAAGHEIPCLHFEYVARLKGPRRDPKDLHDFAIIRERGLLPEGDWG